MLRQIVVALVVAGIASAQDCSDGCEGTDGTCYAVGETWFFVTADANFCQYQKCNSAGQQSTFNYKCYYQPTDECMAPGDSIDTGVCSAVQCSVTDSGAIFRAEVINGCEDAQGTCQSVGASGFSAVVNGQEQASCTCSSYKNDEGVTVYSTSCG